MTLRQADVVELAVANGLGAASIVVHALPRAAVGDGVPPALAIDVAGDAPIYPASMIKVPIAVALAERVAAGELTLADRVAVDASDLTTSDAPAPFVDGYVATLGELGAAMIADSDNVATNVLIRILDRARLTVDARTLGLAATAVRRKLSGSLPLIVDPAATGRNAHPARDAARLFARIDAAYGRYAWILTALRAQRWNDKLSGGWHPDDRFAHKTGDTDECSHDGGILTLAGGARFVVVVYTELAATPETGTRFAAFARALRPHLIAAATDRPTA